MASLQEACPHRILDVTHREDVSSLRHIKDIILTRRCTFRNNLKVKCILFLSVPKLGQRQADGGLALQGGRKNFSRNPYLQNNKIGTFKD